MINFIAIFDVNSFFQPSKLLFLFNLPKSVVWFSIFLHSFSGFLPD